MRIPSTNEALHPPYILHTNESTLEHIHVAHGASSYIEAPSPPSAAITCVVQPDHQYLLPLSGALCGTNYSARFLFTNKTKLRKAKKPGEATARIERRHCNHRYPIPIIRISHRIVPTRHETRWFYSFCLLGNKVQCVAHQSLVD